MSEASKTFFESIFPDEKAWDRLAHIQCVLDMVIDRVPAENRQAVTAAADEVFERCLRSLLPDKRGNAPDRKEMRP